MHHITYIVCKRWRLEKSPVEISSNWLNLKSLGKKAHLFGYFTHSVAAYIFTMSRNELNTPWGSVFSPALKALLYATVDQVVTIYCHGCKTAVHTMKRVSAVHRIPLPWGLWSHQDGYCCRAYCSTYTSIEQQQQQHLADSQCLQIHQPAKSSRLNINQIIVLELPAQVHNNNNMQAELMHITGIWEWYLLGRSQQLWHIGLDCCWHLWITQHHVIVSSYNYTLIIYSSLTDEWFYWAVGREPPPNLCHCNPRWVFAPHHC